MHHVTRSLPAKVTALMLVALFLLGPAAPWAAAQSNPNAQITVPITGTFTDAGGGVGRFVGSFNITRFAVNNGQLVAVGTLTGTLTDSAGATLGTVLRTISLPVSTGGTQASCDILHLELGPLDLDLLGLQVHLDKVVLDIDAQPGPGNLLGNLLCSIANLLNANGALTQIANLLNRILAAL